MRAGFTSRGSARIGAYGAFDAQPGNSSLTSASAALSSKSPTMAMSPRAVPQNSAWKFLTSPSVAASTCLMRSSSGMWARGSPAG